MEKMMRDFLVNELDKAQRDFDEVKKAILTSVENIDPWDCVNFGAAYYTHIDKLTNAGQKIKTIADALSAFDYYRAKGGAQ